MPIYVYRCAKCQERFERAQHISEHESAPPECPKCGATEVESLIAPVFAQTSKKS
jgi:putative FmdB family regulatory protein